MTNKLTLLAQLSKLFGQHPELVATEGLGHILAGSGPAREALQEILFAYGPNIGTIATVRTEVTGSEGERPDLSCSDLAGNESLLIEGKFWASLTDNQPVNYLRRLGDDRPSVLLVVAPFLRFEELWPKLARRVAEAEDLEWTDGKRSGEVRLAAVGKHRLLILTSWRHLLDSLATRTSAAGDIQSTNDIRQLQGLADLQDSESLLPLRPEQLGPELPRLYKHLVQLVDAATKRIYETDWAKKNGMLRIFVESGLRQYMELGGYNSWFALDYDLWGQFGESPLWFGFQDEALNEHREAILSKLTPLRSRDLPKIVEAKPVVPITLLTGAEHDAVLDDVVNQLREIAELLR